METQNDVLDNAKCCKCGQSIFPSGFKFSAYYLKYSNFWHIYCWVRNTYNATKNPNAEQHTTYEIVTLYKY